MLLPDIKRVGVLANAHNALNGINLETVRRIAKNWSITIDAVEIRGSEEIDEALHKLVSLRPDAVLIASDILLLGARRKIVDAMAAARIPAIYPFPEYMEAGAFIIHGANLSVLFERAAVYVDKILKGEKPGDLPVQQATAFELIINLRPPPRSGLRCRQCCLFAPTKSSNDGPPQTTRHARASPPNVSQRGEVDRLEAIERAP